MSKAIHIATGIEGLTFSVGADGVWMNTSGKGVHTSINLSNLAKEDKSGINNGLLNWCIQVNTKYRPRQRYEWKSLNQWDVPKPEYHMMFRNVETGLSKATCRFLLVEYVDQGKGYIKTLPINKSDVTQDMIDVANGNIPTDSIANNGGQK